MTVPAWLLDIFAAIMLLVAAVSAARLAAVRRDPDADIDGSHLLMGVAMAGTLTASLAARPSVAWEVIFGLLTAWFGYRMAREYRAGQGLRALVREHHAPHLLHSAAMLYMFLALRRPSHSAPAGAMGGMGTAGLRLPTLALLFAVLLVAYVVADLDRVPAPRALASPSAPRLATLFALPAPSPALATPAPAVTTTPKIPVISAATAVAGTTEASKVTAPASSAPRRHLGPGVARGCRIAMGVTMAFMLIIMI
jgi:hypothetical protein